MCILPVLLFDRTAASARAFVYACERAFVHARARVCVCAVCVCVCVCVFLCMCRYTAMYFHQLGIPIDTLNVS